MTNDDDVLEAARRSTNQQITLTQDHGDGATDEHVASFDDFISGFCRSFLPRRLSSAPFAGPAEFIRIPGRADIP